MEPLRLPSEEEIGDAYDQGEEAVLELFWETLGKLAERIQHVKDQLAKSSQNSMWTTHQSNVSNQSEPTCAIWSLDQNSNGVFQPVSLYIMGTRSRDHV